MSSLGIERRRGTVRGRRVALSASAALIVTLGVGCREGQREGGGAALSEQAGLTVYVVNYPLAYFAERIGGDLIRVEFPVPGDVDAAYWTPGAEDVVGYQSADLILLNGAGYAGWVGMASLPASKMVNTSQSFADRYIHIEGGMTHSHGLEGEHTHGETAFTTWLDPRLAVLQAEAIRRSLTGASPEAETAFTENFEFLKRDLLSIDDGVENALAGVQAEPLLSSHPVYQYFARRYGLNLESVHFEPDEFPDDRAWSELRALLREHPARWMLWEGRPIPEITARLEELGVNSVVFDPCANVPEAGDYLSVMRANVRNLEEAFGAR
ncbi:MAG: metal ABC transporter substrate-binding protein [Gemmatimonadales bacterium]